MTKKEAKAAYDRARYLTDPASAKARAKRWGQQHPEKLRAYAKKSKDARRPSIREYGRRRYLTRKEQQANYRREKKYQLTPDDYARMLKEQGHECALCPRRSADHKRGGLRIDHCHATQRVRGLLCHQCNSGLGMFNDDPELLRRAADYIEIHREN